MKSSEKYTYSELNSKQEHFSLLCQEEQLGINLIKNVQEAGGEGGGGVGSRFWPRCQQMHDFNGN